ncbi:MAG: 30S ribosomal protein S18 [Bdellovibrionales bacterium]|nr:30S ribosomal protein S18 [Bdellovibrionales bacterium]
MGHFRAQPFDLNFRRRKKLDPFVEDEKLQLDYKDVKLLKRFISERGKILPRRMTGLNAYHQRQVARAVKRAQHLALLSPSEG